MRLKLYLLAAYFAFASACAQAAEEALRYEASHAAMGTVFSVVAYGRDTHYLREVVNEVFDEIDRLDAQMSNYQPQSELSGISRNAARQAVVVEPKLFQLLRDSFHYSEETDGAFDITVGPLMTAWGFVRGPGRMPSRAERARVLRRVGYSHVRLDPARRAVAFDTPGIELDLGGIAKGYAVDEAVKMLRANGVESALVSSGRSSLYALGAPPGERAWKITLRDPFKADQVADVVYLKDYSLSASGNYEKFFKLRGKVYAHILDPRTGRPAENMLATAVLAPQTTESDALSTAFFVLGVEGSRCYLATHPNLQALFYLPTAAKSRFQRLLLRSISYTPPPASLAKFEP